MKILKVGIANYEGMKAHILAIAQGEYKSRKGKPKILFTSKRALQKYSRTRTEHCFH